IRRTQESVIVRHNFQNAFCINDSFKFVVRRAVFVFFRIVRLVSVIGILVLRVLVLVILLLVVRIVFLFVAWVVATVSLEVLLSFLLVLNVFGRCFGFSLRNICFGFFFLFLFLILR